MRGSSVRCPNRGRLPLSQGPYTPKSVNPVDSLAQVFQNTPSTTTLSSSYLIIKCEILVLVLVAEGDDGVGYIATFRDFLELCA